MAAGRVINVILAVAGASSLLLLLYFLDTVFLLVLLHDLAHFLSLILSLALAWVAVVSYLRDGRTRYILLSAAFTVLTIHEALTFLSTSFIPLAEPVIPLIRDPVTHWLNLAMITLLFTGLIVKDQRE